MLWLKYFFLICILVFFCIHTVFVFTENPRSIETYVEIFVMIVAGYLLVKEINENRRFRWELKHFGNPEHTMSERLKLLIGSKLDSWELSPKEKDVAWLLIKGHLIKEIAFFRGVSEKTVHSQLNSIYKKSNTRNRSEFTTQFIQAVFDSNL